jgi:hypothetical protein
MKQLYAINNIPKTDIKGKLKKRVKVAGRRYRVILDPTKEESLRYKMVMNACKEKNRSTSQANVQCLRSDQLDQVKINSIALQIYH